MTTESSVEHAANVRRRAEEMVQASDAPWRLTMSHEATQELLHELHVHQIELEIQNEELRRAQVALDIARMRYVDLYDMAPVGYFTVNKKGSIQEANLTASTMLGIPRDDLLTQAFTSFIAKEYQDRYYLFRNALFETGEPATCELRIVKKSGLTLEVDLAATLSRLDGKAQVARIVIVDISERKRSEIDKASLEAQLHQAQKMESVGRLAGGVAHDFNNMLGVIIGNAELALRATAPELQLHHYLEEIIEAAGRSADLTRQLLAFAREQTVAPRVLNLNDTIPNMLNMLRRLVGECIELIWNPADAIWPIRIDPSQIDQILANLCVNSRDAIADIGRITIHTKNQTFDHAYCAAHPGLIPGDYVQIAVTDDGCGMDEETLSHLFEPFYTTKGVGKGTGLGLSTVYGAVKQNVGFIDAISDPGHGTTFNIYLPRYVGHGDPERIKRLAAATTRSGETILLVEDELSVLTSTQRLLQSLGYVVLPASDPIESIELAREHVGEIHLLLTDVVMPGMNGKDLAKRMLELIPQLKCVFMSGYTADIVAHHGVLDDGISFIQKPFCRDELQVKLREQLDLIELAE